MRDYMLKGGRVLSLAVIGAVLLLTALGCSDPRTPSLLWEYPLSQVEKENPRFSYSVFIDDGIAVVDIRGNELHALDAATGQVLWRRANERGQKWHYRVSEGAVYLSQSRKVGETKVDVNTYTFSYSTEVFALDARSGEVIWQYRPEPDRLTDGFLLSEGVLAVRSDPFLGLDAETGRLLWEARFEGVTNDASGGVMFVEERIERAQEPRYEFGVSAVDMNTGETLWRQVHSSVDVAGAADDIVLVRRSPDPHLYGLDAKTGRTLWTHHQRGRSLWPKSEGDGVVIVESKQLHSYPPDYKGIRYPVVYPIDEFCVVSMSNGKTLWCGEMEEGDGVTRLGDFVYLTSGNTGRVLDARTGEELWSREGKDGVDGAAPQLRKSGEVVYVNDHGMISALHPTTWAVRWQYQLEWDDDPSDWRDNPFIWVADDDVVVLWTGEGLAAVGIPPRGVDPPLPLTAPLELCSNGVVVPDPQDNPGLVSDCAVLLSVRDSLIGESGTLASEAALNWSADLPIARWDGVSTVEPGRRPVVVKPGATPPARPVGLPDRVRILKLGWSDGPRGEVPAELAGLTELDRLILDSYYLSGGIPPELGQLAKLEELRLGDGLAGAIPPELGQLANLKELQLGNGLTGPIPPELGRLVHLEELRLGNELTGPVSPELGALANLRRVAIHGSYFTGCLPVTWKKHWIADSSGAELDYCE